MINNHDLSTMHGNKKVLIDRIQLNLFLTFLGPKDYRQELADKILNRAEEIEKKSKKYYPCMDVPIRVSEVRRLYPDGIPSNTIY